MNKSPHSAEYQTFLRELRQARLEAGLTQVQVAERLDEPQSWVSRIEKGETRVTVIELHAYCRAIGRDFAAFAAVLDASLKSP